MKMLLFILVFGLVGCDSETTTVSGHSITREQIARRRYYGSQLIPLKVKLDRYSEQYAADHARCKPRVEQFYCEQAKSDMAHIKWARQQQLAIAQQIAADASLPETDRQDASASLAQLESEAQ
jgi:hypothetical protein